MTEVWRGRFLRVLNVDTWEFATRVRASGVVGVIAFTDDGGLVLVEQHRIPVGTSVIELPAGLVGDQDDAEASRTAAERELLEETGFVAEQWRPLSDGPSSSGHSAERVEIWLATGLRRVAEGGGDGSEAITVHVVPGQELQAFLRSARARGALIDPKVFMGLWVCGVAWDGGAWLP